MNVLKVENLTVTYFTPGTSQEAVSKLNLAIKEDEILGLVGESGCGKSTVAKAILRLLPKNSEYNGKILFGETDMLKLGDWEMRKLRGNNISLIPQAAMNVLDPVYRVGDQLIEGLQAHSDIDKEEAKSLSLELFNSVSIERKKFFSYPHQLSGGQKQRVIIAMALATNPEIILADEPTTGLDVLVQQGILDLMNIIRRDKGVSILLITHNISAIYDVADSVAVMYAGKLFERGEVESVFGENSAHPYTMGLQNAFPRIGAKELISIPGSPPKRNSDKYACSFYDRCPFRIEKCKDISPPKQLLEDGHVAFCHHVEQAEKLRELSKSSEVWER